MTISKTHYIDGSAPTAAELNAPYDDLATESAAISSSHTASGWITNKHLSPGTVFNRCYSYVNSTTTEVSYSGQTWTTINDGTDDAELTPNYTAEALECLRISACGLVTETTLGDNASGAERNYYAFRLLLTYDAGAGDVTVSVGEWGYSFTTRALVTDISDLTGDFSANKIQWQTFQFSTLYQIPVANVVIKKIELQAATYDATFSFKVSRHQLFLISAPH